MAELSDLELQDLRHLIAGCELSVEKLTFYSEHTTDAPVKNFFEQGIQSAKTNKEQLMGFLS